MSRVFIIGLDGGTMDLLGPMIDRGLMPNLGALIAGGVHGPLRTCFPPSTGPAWASIATGRNPGKHGIFNFLKNSDSGIGQRVINSGDIHAQTLWQILSGHEKRVGVVNVPVSYPPQEVNGFVVSGMMTPSLKSELTYPSELKHEILKEIGDYVITVKWTHYGGKKIGRFLSDLRYCHRKRSETVYYLMENKPWDFFMVVFTGTDRIQHALWNYIDPAAPPGGAGASESVTSQIYEYYRDVDTTIGQIRERLDPDDVLLIVSDHGFGAMGKKVHTNKWLQEEGYLALKRGKYWYSSLRARSWQGLMKAVSGLDRYKVRKRLAGAAGIKTLRKLGGLEDRFMQFYGCVDWKRTRAFVSSITEQTGIYLNASDRSPLGIVPPEEYEPLREEIIARLKNLKEPGNSEPVVSGIMKREEYYIGPFTRWAPDILFIIKDCEYRSDMFLASTVFEEPDGDYGGGCHRMDGIFIANGGPVKKGGTCRQNIYDICPTVLYLMGIPIPDDVDGAVAMDILEDSFTSGRPVEYEPAEASDAVAAELSAKEESELRERLKGLGYLS